MEEQAGRGKAPIGLVAVERQAECTEMGANLVGATGGRTRDDAAAGAFVPAHLPVGQGRFAGADLHASTPPVAQRDRAGAPRLDFSARAEGPRRGVALLHEALREEASGSFHAFVGVREHDEAAGLDVEAVDGARAGEQLHAGRRTGERGHRETGRLAHDLEVPIAVESDDHSKPPGEPVPITPLPPEHLRWRVPAEVLAFGTTADLDPTEDFVGQANALAALRRGVELQAPGFNVYVAGLPSTGRLGAVERIVRRVAPRRRSARDLVYVRNFVEPARPRLLEFPPGRGVTFRRELQRVAMGLVEEIPRLLAAGDVRRQREAGTHDAAAASHVALQKLRAHARELGFVVGDLGEDEETEPVVFWVEPAAEGVERDEAKAPVHSRTELTVLAKAGEITLPRPLADILGDFDLLAQGITGACTQHQRQISDAVKNSREVALHPYTSTAR